jgi:hypothetical protein
MIIWLLEGDRVGGRRAALRGKAGATLARFP